MTLPWTVSELLPHSGPMLLIGEPITSGDTWAEASVRIGEDSQFYQSGRGVPSWVGVEYMAQTIALYAGISARRNGQHVKIGFLLGTRRYEVQTEYFCLGTLLRIRADRVWQDAQMAVFECHIDDGDRLAEAQLNVFQPDDTRAFLEEQRA
jgi:predicted hotdog family 3-hydroxylacyl-ACP dehydratase